MDKELAVAAVHAPDRSCMSFSFQCEMMSWPPSWKCEVNWFHPDQTWNDRALGSF